MKFEEIKPDSRNIFLFWNGPVKPEINQLISANIRSLRKFNPSRPIYVVSNTLEAGQFCLEAADAMRVSFTFDSLIGGTPADVPAVRTAYENRSNEGRIFSVLFRFAALFKKGGTYTDTDNLAIRPLPDLGNIFCRTYDPHAFHLHKRTEDDCIDGRFRESGQFPEIPFYLRIDCMLNFDPGNEILELVLRSVENNENKPLVIGARHSFQRILTDHVKRRLLAGTMRGGIGLNLIYLYESFLSSDWGVVRKRGELFEAYARIGHAGSFGQPAFTREEAIRFLAETSSAFPTSCFLWMSDKDDNRELFGPPLGRMRLSSQIFHHLQEV